MLKRIEIDADEQESPALDTRVKPVVRILNGALDEDPSSPAAIVLNGRLDPATLRFLKVDETYQRPLGDRGDIFDAIKEGKIVPNIDIGVRGQDFTVEGDNYLIHSPAYIIDGWQRVGTALRVLEANPAHPIRIFATVHFGTTDLWERHRFTELNKNVKKVSPNLHMRNMRDSNEAVLTLFGLSNNTKDFPLYKKVSWGQNMARGELLTAIMLAKTAMRLHAHHTSINGVATETIATALSAAAKAVTLTNFRKNISTFFEIVDECWNLRTIEFRHAAPQIKTQFLSQLAKLFSSHIDFWVQGERIFFVPADVRRKLAKFPLTDPHVRNLAGSSGSSGHILYEMLVRHMDSGKRTGHLRPRAMDSRGHIIKAA